MVGILGHTEMCSGRLGMNFYVSGLKSRDADVMSFVILRIGRCASIMLETIVFSVTLFRRHIITNTY